MKRTFISLTTLLLLLITSCTIPKEKQKKSIMPETTEETPNEKVSLKETLAAVPSSVLVGENNLTLEVILWVNLMPSPDGNDEPPLFSNISLIDINEIDIPSTLKLTRQYIKQGDTIREIPLEKVFQDMPYKLSSATHSKSNLILNNTVDVICEFEYNNETYRVAAKSQKIKTVH